MNNKIKILADNKIPMLKGVLEPFAHVYYCNPFDISKEIVKDKDALIIRTRTKCDSKLLEGSSVKLITTATIGYDHIDTAYCETNKIKWVNAPGCNSTSVMQYISAALVTISKMKKFNLSDKTLGVVGVGNVGSKVAKAAKLLGMKVLLNDPPRMRAEGEAGFVNLVQLMAESDIITFHVPLIKDGIDKTFHMADEQFFDKLSGKKIIFNTSRGPVVKTEAIKSAIRKGSVDACVLDVWENEPEIDKALLGLVDIATPHIAGYSSDGKANGTAACVNEINAFFNLGLDNNWYPSVIPQPGNSKIIQVYCDGKTNKDILNHVILTSYNIEKDDAALRTSIETFEKQRGSYPVRREFTYYDVRLFDGNKEIETTLKDLGFNVLK